jgi:ABC-type Mn2+/Zn2+ transport system ATPase subunit
MSALEISGGQTKKTMNEPLVKLDNLSIGYNGRSVLSGISLTIARASFTAILGVNGSGKTTLLKTVLGLLPPVAGRIEVSPAGSSLMFGYVPQSTQFDPVYLLTAFEVALMGAYSRVRPGRFVPPTERAFTRECLHAAGAEEFARKRFSELSGGQKQRVLIARALTTRPDILVLDEPTAGVDNTATHATMDFISQVREERNITVLLVTHDFAMVRQYADQVIWLHEGKVVYGAAHEMLTAEHIKKMLEGSID